jgi:anaerobic ribonucleoside-triphosphate reductase activating protein
MPDTIRVHAILEHTRANGPGDRFAVWLQGCPLRCPGCFNPETLDLNGGQEVGIEDLLARIDAAGVEGVTVSGGEPLLQIDDLIDFLAGIRILCRLPVILFSGYSREEILAMPHGSDVLGLADVLIAGRYRQGERVAAGLRGSENKQVHLLTNSYTREEIEATPELEFQIGADGAVLVSGINPPEGM